MDNATNLTISYQPYSNYKIGFYTKEKLLVLTI